MAEDSLKDAVEGLDLAYRWCQRKGSGWSVLGRLGEGGTAPVFEITSPQGLRALKIYDLAFSSGDKGEVERKRIDQQVALIGHKCSSLVQVYEGGRFENRLYLLMSRAPGRELAKHLNYVPHEKIRHIVDQIARAAIFLQSKDLCHRDIKAANIFVSEDFSQATLLDISVIRNIHDPVGVGSDSNGQLPVLATARYAPPEYLFRLLEPGPVLWHALNIYQMGALIHDLVMGQSLFEGEYLKSSSNRYRFAWVIATAIPNVESGDVDQDLIFIAKRALDKDWERRSNLRLEDFLSDAKVREEHAFQLLGLGTRPIAQQDDDIASKLKRLREISGALELAILLFLKKNEVIAKHTVIAGTDDTSKLLVYRWESPGTEAKAAGGMVEFHLALHLTARSNTYRFRISAKLASLLTAQREASMELPELQDDPGVELALAKQAQSAFAHLAVKITQANPEAKKE